jgi:hypothetical protein
MLTPKPPEYFRPNNSNIARTANRHRQIDRPTEPQDMDFEVFFNIIIHVILLILNQGLKFIKI